MIELQSIFNIDYGHSLELNKLKLDADGINFVSRTAKNNGVSAKVSKTKDYDPIVGGAVTVSLGGSVLEAFLQDEPFYTGYHIYVLTPKKPMSDLVKLFYCMCIRENKYRYSYGRQANRTLRSLLVPSLDAIPDWVNEVNLYPFIGAERPASPQCISSLDKTEWKDFIYSDLFDIGRGKGPRIKDLDGLGSVPFITSIDNNNGLTGYTTHSPMHSGNVISVNRNGSVAEAYYQHRPFCSTEDVHIFTPKFKLNEYIAMFLITLIKMEKYRYNYGRKWGIARMKQSIIKLPVSKDGQPDWAYMERYIKSLPFSSRIAQK